MPAKALELDAGRPARSGSAARAHPPSIVPALDALTAHLAQATGALAVSITVFDGQNRWITTTHGPIELVDETALFLMLHDACGAVMDHPVSVLAADRMSAICGERIRVAGGLPKQLDILCMSGRAGASRGALCVLDASPDGTCGALLSGFSSVVMRLLDLHDQVDDFQHIVMLSPHMSVVLDAQGAVTEIAGSLRALLGIEAGPNLDRQFRALVHPGDDDALAEAWRRALADEIPVEIEYRLRVREQGFRWFRFHAKPRCDASGRVSRWCALLEDVHERHEDRLRLAHLAYHDALTGLSNRAHFRMALALRFDDPGPSAGFAVARLELHDFRAVTNAFGETVGDRLLLGASRRIAAGVRDGDLLAHGGGNEFFLLLGGIETTGQATAVLDDVLLALEPPMQVDGSVVAVSASVGATLSRAGDGAGPDSAARDIDALMQNADLALMRARSEGRGKVCFYSHEMGERIRRVQALKVDLTQALEGRQLFLVYQPVLDARTGQVSGLEALVRWRHPTHGIVSPADFIPEAETSGLIVPIGRWVLQQACRDAAGWPASLHVAVNLSAVQVRVPGLADTVAQALEWSGLDPVRLVLEITKSVPLLGEADNLATLGALRGLGARIALDDFGTGYASLAYLQCFLFDTIKIERSFVQRMLDSAEARIILRSVIRLSHSLCSLSVAEGVETAEQFEVLHDEGCDCVQGYLFSRPVDATAVIATVAALDEQAHGGRWLAGPFRAAVAGITAPG